MRASVEGRYGKVLFYNEHSLQGNVQIQQDSDGQEFVTVTFRNGRLTFPRSEIKEIYFPRSKPEATTQSCPQSSSNQSPYEPFIRIASQKNRLDPELVKAVIRQESNFNVWDVSGKGAQGLMQLMPETAKLLGVENVFDPWDNIHGGTKFLRDMLEMFQGDLIKALAAYNAGPQPVKRYGTVPPYPETQEYVKKVLYYYKKYQKNRLYAYEGKDGNLVFSDQPYQP
ncbi:MAG: lytic transglycosylase domain-containing protein [Elusimicrobia bacterium]|nr:lytic transglycosylase domain-containing protein [Elusimicrobiota bacterium]